MRCTTFSLLLRSVNTHSFASEPLRRSQSQAIHTQSRSISSKPKLSYAKSNSRSRTHSKVAKSSGSVSVLIQPLLVLGILSIPVIISFFLSKHRWEDVDSDEERRRDIYVQQINATFQQKINLWWVEPSKLSSNSPVEWTRSENGW